MSRFQRFNAHGASPRERFECWRAWYTDTIDRALRLDPLVELPVDFSSSGEVLAVGEVVIADVRCGPTAVSWRRDAVDDGRLRLILFYGATGLIGGWDGARTSNLDGRTIVVGGRTGTGWWCAPAGLRAIQLSVPAAGLGECFVRLLSGEPVNAALVRPLLLGMAGRLGDLSNTSGLDGVCRSLVVMLVQSLARGDPGAGTADRNGSDRAAALRSRALRLIDAHLSDPRLCPADIAAALYVSRRTLYHVLAPGGGTGVAAAVRRRRLQLARRLLLDPALRGRSIAQIAAEVGLPNPAHFSRLFRAEFGTSPREVRLGAGCGSVHRTGADLTIRARDPVPEPDSAFRQVTSPENIR